MKTGARRSAAGSGRRSDASGARRERLASGAHPLLSVALPAWRSKLMLFMLFVASWRSGARILPDGRCHDGVPAAPGRGRYARTLEIPQRVDASPIATAWCWRFGAGAAVWAIPEDVSATPAQIAELARLLDMSAAS